MYINLIKKYTLGIIIIFFVDKLFDPFRNKKLINSNKKTKSDTRTTSLKEMKLFASYMTQDH